MIKVSKLVKRYGSVLAVDDLSFEVKKGEVVGFLGPNGAGKTTTMRIITGFMGPSSGEAFVNDLDVFQEPLRVKEQIGYLPETPPLYMDMRVDEYLRFVAQLKLVPKGKVSAQVESVVEKTGLGEVRKRLIGHLSKGFRQRVGIAQALVSDPVVLVLDEPTVGLDPRQVAEVRNLIRSLKGEHTIILSTHILPEVQATCERIIIINKGRIVAQDSLESLTSKVSGHHRLKIRVQSPGEKFLETAQAVKGIYSVTPNGSEGVFQIEFNGDEGVQVNLAKTLIESGVGLLELSNLSENLEDIFIRLTTTKNPGVEV